MRSLAALLARPGPIIMGILNVTPDSFSDGGDYVSLDLAIRHAQEMAEQGAEIIDIGGESTRPAGKTYGTGARHVKLEEELRRVIPVIGEVRSKLPEILLSIDTQKSYIANAAIQTGADMINDVSAGTSDPEMFSMAAKHHVPLILMHGHGPDFKQASVDEYHYSDVVRDVTKYLEDRIALARAAGVKEVLADVGVGFGKNYADNLKLNRNHQQFTSLGVPLVLGVSRKSSIGRAMGGSPAPKERVPGSLAAACYGVLHGAKIIRTHDVKETKQALNVIEAIDGA